MSLSLFHTCQYKEETAQKKKGNKVLDLEVDHKYDRKSQLKVRFPFQVPQLLEYQSQQQLWLFPV